jgi:beta-glucosidase/6-phospho-beta-glucosidase/beta-galactosidase
MIQFPKDFFFGVSNAANQVEDQLHDTWSTFADQGKVRCFQGVPQNKDKICFWSRPEIELDLAQDLGVDVFRLSLAWERLSPSAGVWNQEAADHYLDILKSIKKRGMRVMLTLFHHAIPSWMQERGGWVEADSVDHFQFYAQKSFEQFNDSVDYWLTLNEPVPWSFLTYAEGLFPPGKKGSWFMHQAALKNMAKAHNDFHQYVNGNKPVGIAHHMGFHTGRGPFNKAVAKISDHLTHWSFLKLIKGRMDFFGINYYGAEWMTLSGPAQYADLDFSDAGRAIDPKGLLYLLRKICLKFPKIPIIVTENGVGDGTDRVRPAYLTQHLLAVHLAIKEGIPVKGYVHWTLTDNMEWTDGYGPKFGLVEVVRSEGLKRVPRPSFELYKAIIKNREISDQTLEASWHIYEDLKGEARPYWRSSNGKNGLDVPEMRPTPKQDWRLKEI